MAQVPNYGGPRVMPSILGYRPMSDNIPNVPKMEVNFDKVGDRLDKFYTKFLEEQDEARVTAALTELRRKAVDLETADDGWAQQFGENALAPDEQGRGLIERTDTGLHRIGESISSTLTARQQKLFNEKAQNIYQATYAGVSQHVFQQGVKQKVAAQEGVVNQAVEFGAAYVTKPDLLKQNATNLREAADRLAEFQGWTQETKDMYIKKNTSAMYMNGIATLLAGSDKNPAIAYRALGVLQAHSKEMLPSDVARARQQINPIIQAHEDRLKVEQLVAIQGMNGEVLPGGLAKAVQSGIVTQDVRNTARGYEAIISVVSQGGHQSVTAKEGDIADWKHGASQLTVAQAEEAAKMSKQPWDPKAFKTDRDYNQSLGLGRYNGMLTEFAGDEQKSMAGYLSSVDTVRKAEKEAKEKGGVWTDYLPTKTQETLNQASRNMRRSQQVVDKATGKTVSGFDPRYASAAKQWMTTDQIREHFRNTDARAKVDPLYCDELVNKATVLLNQKKQSYVQQQNNVKAQISNILFKSHGDTGAIPQELLQQLDVNELADVQKLASHYQSETFASNPFTLGKLSDDGFLSSLSQDELTLYLNELNGKDRSRVLQKWSALKQGMVGSDDAKANLDRLTKLGMAQSDYVVPDAPIKEALSMDPKFKELQKESPEMAAMYVNTVQDRLSLMGQERYSKLNEDEIKKAVWQISREIVPVSGLFGTKDKALFSVTVKDLPNSGLTDVSEILKRTTKNWLETTGQDREPTENELQYAFMKIMLGDDRLPFVIPEDVGFDEPLMKEVRKTWEEKHPGQKLSQIQELRLYFKARIAGKELESPYSRGYLDNSYIQMGVMP